jgi:hypothetical protein
MGGYGKIPEEITSRDTKKAPVQDVWSFSKILSVHI